MLNTCFADVMRPLLQETDSTAHLYGSNIPVPQGSGMLLGWGPSILQVSRRWGQPGVIMPCASVAGRAAHATSACWVLHRTSGSPICRAVAQAGSLMKCTQLCALHPSCAPLVGQTAAGGCGCIRVGTRCSA